MDRLIYGLILLIHIFLYRPLMRRQQHSKTAATKINWNWLISNVPYSQNVSIYTLHFRTYIWPIQFCFMMKYISFFMFHIGIFSIFLSCLSSFLPFNISRLERYILRTCSLYMWYKRTLWSHVNNFKYLDSPFPAAVAV